VPFSVIGFLARDHGKAALAEYKFMTMPFEYK
jgi:hypothetical protein